MHVHKRWIECYNNYNDVEKLVEWSMFPFSGFSNYKYRMLSILYLITFAFQRKQELRH